MLGPPVWVVGSGGAELAGGDRIEPDESALGTLAVLDLPVDLTQLPDPVALGVRDQREHGDVAVGIVFDDLKVSFVYLTDVHECVAALAHHDRAGASVDLFLAPVKVDERVVVVDLIADHPVHDHRPSADHTVDLDALARGGVAETESPRGPVECEILEFFASWDDVPDELKNS